MLDISFMVFTTKSRDRYSLFHGYLQVTIFSNFQRPGSVPHNTNFSAKQNEFRCHEHFLFIGINKTMEF